jgi:AcrR family transcriptional regulator
MNKRKPARPSRKTQRVKRRGSHADRSAATQKKVIAACIDGLHRIGFQATTTSWVAERARISRGALLQQYPTRLDMILSAAEHGIRSQCEATAELVKSMPPGVQRYHAMVDDMQSEPRRPLRMALIELQLAARADPDLAVGLQKRVYPVLREEFADAWRVANAAGFADRELFGAQAVLTLACLWGLSIMGLRMQDSELAPALALLKENRDRLLAWALKT